MNRSRWQTPEILLGVLGGVTLILLLARATTIQPASWLSLALVVYLIGIYTTRPSGPLRMLVNYGFTLWFYMATSWLVPALRVPIRNEALLRSDQAIFGQTPSVALQEITSPWLTDVMSLFYLSYLVYLHIVLVHALFKTDTFRRTLSTPAFGAFALGLTGYLLIPAQCPGRAFPELYLRPLSGGFLTHFTDWIALHAAAAYDVFPSLHVLITLILLSFDWDHGRGRFWIMLVPAAMLILSTIYLRFHYGVDLLASSLLFSAYLLGRHFLGKS